MRRIMRSLGQTFVMTASVVAVLALMAGPAATITQAQAKSCSGDECEHEREMTARRREIAQLRAEMESMLQALSESADSSDPRSLVLLQRKLSSVMRQLQVTQMVIEADQAKAAVVRASAPRARLLEVSRPPGNASGWIGVSLSASLDESRTPDGNLIWQFNGYPVVESVDPASPAKRAGIEVGDVLLAFNDRDLSREAIPHDEILTPGKRMQVRIRRGKLTRTVALTVTEKPAWHQAILMPIAPEARFEVTQLPAMAPPAPLVTSNLFFGSSTAALVGAEFIPVSEMPDNFVETVGASAGLLILDVGPGTPAARSGLRRGDLIVTVAGKKLASPRQLQVAMSEASPHNELPLEVMRNKKPLELTLRW